MPLEDWEVKNGRVECNSRLENATLTLLPYQLTDRDGSFHISVRMGLLESGMHRSSVGIRFGITDPSDPDPRAGFYFGEGERAGINTGGFAFLGQSFTDLGEGFDFSEFSLDIECLKSHKGSLIRFRVLDSKGEEIAILEKPVQENLSGIVQIVSNMVSAKSERNADTFWFDDLFVEGGKFEYQPGERFGPILWTMHTLSEQSLKMTAQFPPLGDEDPKLAMLQLMDADGNWMEADQAEIDALARCAVFRVDRWDGSRDRDYRVVYTAPNSRGEEVENHYEGTIRRDPADRPLRMGAMTCQFWTGFPYTPVHNQLADLEPDLLYFSGDQIYEGNGGDPIKNFPDPKAINSYLGKWYMFGWVFGDLMRDVPTICTPDDHDIFQGNLWGGSGIRKTDENRFAHDRVGFDQSIETVNAVNRTQCAHLPDPFDPTPIGEGMSVWYTDLVYGRVSFGIGSEQIVEALPDMSQVHKPGLELLGKRQEEFLEQWIRNWNGADMKVLLSQTVFANAATHYGGFNNHWYGDMDSGGWPKEARDRAIRILRKGFAFHITGDQHLPTLSQYGVDDYRDAGWCFCTPAISVCYSRWFRPDDLDLPVRNRPEHGLPNTGEYKDAFGNYNYVYAVGNPGDYHKVEDRYEFENSKSSGLGFVVFDTDSRDITIESWKMCGGQHPGWPHTINQLDNYGREAAGWLPTLEILGDADPVLELYEQATGELVYSLRISGRQFTPKVFHRVNHKLRVGYPEKDLWIDLEDIQVLDKPGMIEKTLSFEN